MASTIVENANIRGRLARASLVLLVTLLASISLLVQWDSSRSIDAQAVGSITRAPASETASAGDLLTITLSPFAVSNFYAVREDLDGLSVVSHTADAFENGVFVSVSNEPFSYTVEVPSTATPGQQFTISGDFWEDPGVEFAVDPTQTTITVVAATSSVTRTLSADTLGDGETATVTLTPSGISDFYAVREDLDGLVLVSHDADAFSEGVFVRLGDSPIEYTVGLPADAFNGQLFDINGRFWQDPGLEHAVAPETSQVTSTVPAPVVDRSLSTDNGAPGDLITVTMTPSEIDLAYSVREDLGTLQLMSHTADALEGDLFLMDTADPFTYTVRIPLDASDGAQLPISGEFWEVPELLWDVSPAVSTITVSGSAPAAAVTRSVEEESITPGEVVTVTLTPTGIDLFYAVEETLGDLELISHTADGFEDGVFLMLTPDPFTYDVLVPADAQPEEVFPVNGMFWQDPGAELLVSPSVTELSVDPVIGLSFVPGDIPLAIGETGTVEIHVDDLRGEEVDTVQVKIAHDPAEVTISGADCIGIMSTGAPSAILREESTNSSWFTCSTTDPGGVSGESGAVVSFDVTRVGQAMPVLEMLTGGATGTELFRSGVGVGLRVVPLNVLEILPDTTLTGTVTLQAVIDEQAFAVIAPEVTLQPTLNGRATSAPVNADGTFEVKGVVDGTYNVILDAPGSLGRLLVGLVVDGDDIELQPIQLRSGLADGDDTVAGADISAVAGNFGLSPDDLDGRLAPGTALIVDFDGDGWVTAFDISIVQSNMGESKFQEWTDPAVSGP